MFGDNEIVNNGRCSSISVIWEEKRAVAVTDFSFSPFMSYYVGKINATGGAIRWGPAQSYTSGKWPRVVLVKMEDDIYAVEVHNPVISVRQVSHYLVWKLNRNNSKMEGEMKGKEFHAGFYPRLCANTEGLVVAVGEHQHLIVLGHIDLSSGSPQMRWERQSLNCKIHNNPSIDMCGNKFVIAYSKNGNIIETIVGEINNDEVTTYQKFSTNELGQYPSISLNSHNQVFLCYQTMTWRKLIFICGKITDSRVSLNNQMAIRNQTTAGEYPSVCLSNEGDIFVIYKMPFGLKLRIKRGIMSYTTELSRPSHSCTTTSESSEIALCSVERPNDAGDEVREDHSEV